MTRAMLPSARVRDIAKQTLERVGPNHAAAARIRVLYQLASAARMADQPVTIDLADFALIADDYVPMPT